MGKSTNPRADNSTIMPRGQALGITFQLPEQDKGELRALHLHEPES